MAETVNATRELGHARAAGFVNAVLRRFQRERDAVLAVVDADLAVRTAHPGWLVAMLERDRPDDAVAILEADNEHPPMWLRVNRQRATVAECVAALEAAGFRVEPHPIARQDLAGINVGMNLGRPAGAGIADHIHLHVVPRWTGDTSFMTVVSGTRVIPEEPEEACRRLRPYFDR